ncbi:MAG: diguanylate cyclase, partial [Thermodesulfobacteriota bacterium]
MGLFRKTPKSEMSVDVLQQDLDECRRRTAALVHLGRSLLFFLKEFSLDIAEIDVQGYKKTIDGIAEQIREDALEKDIRRSLEDNKLAIVSYIEKEKRYLQEKEQELKNIIELLRSALTDFMGETQTFNSRIYEQNVRMEAITQLDDLRKIKESLQVEVSQMKKIIQEKQQRDSKRIETLSKEVVSLKSNLEEVQAAASTDALTGAFNRLAFDAKIQWCVERNAVIREPLSLLMCDIDDFKKINDTYGHVTG